MPGTTTVCVVLGKAPADVVLMVTDATHTLAELALPVSSVHPDGHVPPVGIVGVLSKKPNDVVLGHALGHTGVGDYEDASVPLHDSLLTEEALLAHRGGLAGTAVTDTTLPRFTEIVVHQ